MALHDDNILTDEQLQDLRSHAATRINDQRKKAKKRFDDHHAVPKTFREGDLVLAENEPTSTGFSKKLEPRYKGPFIVTKVLDKDRYVIENLPQSNRTQRHYSSVFASDKLKEWCQLPPDDDDDIEDDESEDAPVGQESRL